MAAEWYFQSKGKIQGPVDSLRIRRMARAGRLHPDTPVAKKRDGKWVAAKNVKGLFNGLAPAPYPSLADYEGGRFSRAVVNFLGVSGLFHALVLTVFGCLLLVDVSWLCFSPGQATFAIRLIIGLSLSPIAAVLLVVAAVCCKVGFGVWRRRPGAHNWAILLTPLTGPFGLLMLCPSGFALREAFDAADWTTKLLGWGFVVYCLSLPAHAILTLLVLTQRACTCQFLPAQLVR